MNTDGYLVSLEAKHTSLEKAILDESQRPNPDTIRITQLKREKLKLKERMERLLQN
ncbi:MAG TPA: YdcH family protein [Sphingomonadales bacterium]